jgi:crossover junction endodeoxyribonuclease RuvC
MARLIGVDPGATGALALFENGRLAQVWDTPTVRDKGRPRVDAAALGALIISCDAASAFVERVGAMPGQGVTSMFQFGRACGIVEGVLGALSVPVTYVTPTQWKGALKVPAAKDGARLRASQLMPHGAAWWPKVGHHGRAEAALIGLYGVRIDGKFVEW